MVWLCLDGDSLHHAVVIVYNVRTRAELVTSPAYTPETISCSNTHRLTIDDVTGLLRCWHAM